MYRFMTTLLIAVLFITACGTRVVWAQGGVTLYGHGNYKSAAAVWSGPLIWDDDFATKLFNEIPNYKNISFVFDQCYAGGFINDLAFVNAQAWPYIAGNERSGLTISTSSRWDRYMYYIDGPTSFFTFFTDPWNEAVDTPTFDDFGDAHLNAENVTRQRCITYGVTQSQPQYHSNPTQMDNLTLSVQAGDDQRYAIIFAGLANSKAFYNAGSEIYNILITHYGYTDNDIALLWGDGTHQVMSSGATWNKIDLSATKQNLWNVLTDMGASGGSYDKVGSDDRLLVYFVGHGGQNNSNITIASTLSNFDVKNKTGATVDDFHLVVSGIHSSDITGYYTGSQGWGNPTSVNYNSTNNQTDITWVGSAADGDWVHHGVHLKSNVQPTDYEAWWTVGGSALPAIGQVPVQWQPQAGNEVRAVILNMTGRPVIISNLESAIVSEHIELNNLIWEYVPEGGWIPDPNERIMMESLEPNDPTKGYIDDIKFDGSDYDPVGGYSLLLRYEIIDPEAGDWEPYWRNVVAVHIIPEPDQGPPPVGRPEPIDPGIDGLIAHYAFENDTLDSSGNALDGTIIGDPVFVDGVEGLALDFNGDDYVDCGGNVEFSFTNAMTVSTWVKIRSITTAWMAMIAKGENAWRLGFNNDTTGVHYAFTGGARGWQAANTATELDFDQWYHVAATYDTNVGATVYINGVPDASNPDLGGIVTNEFSLLLGDNPEATGRFLDGMLDEVEIYDRALSGNEIRYLAGERATPVDPGSDGLVAYYALESDANDNSGNGLDGTIFGGPNFVKGAVGMGLQLDGVDDYVDFGNDPLFDITEQITLSVWVNTQDIGNGENDPWLGKGDTSYMIKGHREGNQIEFFIYDGGWNVAHADVGAEFNGEWHHAAGTFDGEQLLIYVDGEVVVKSDYVGSIALSTYNVALGTNIEAGGRFSEGIIDEAMIYNRALSAGEILYLAGMKSEVENLLADGDFERGPETPLNTWEPLVWSWYDNAGGGTTMEVVSDDPAEGDYCLHVVVPDIGANTWDVGLKQGGHVFEAGKSYTLSASLKSISGTLDIHFKPERDGDPWEGYGEQTFTITEEWAEYTVNTGVIPETVSPAAITFHIGFAPGDFQIDKVVFTED